MTTAADHPAIPDFLNVRLTRTPAQLAAAAAGMRRQIEDYRKRVPTHMKPPAPGSKEAQLRALRTGHPLPSGAKAPAVKKPHKPVPSAPAQPQETTMPKNPKSKTAGKSKTKTARRGGAKKRSSAQNIAAPKNPNTPRPGSKLEIVVGLLQRPEGCTAKEVLEATGWPAVSMPQQAQAAHLTLRKEKEGAVTRYFAE